MFDREEIELRAKECCPAEDFYDLLDTIDETSTEDLLRLIYEHEGVEEDEEEEEEKHD